MDIRQLQQLVPEPGRDMDVAACLAAIPALARLAAEMPKPKAIVKAGVSCCSKACPFRATRSSSWAFPARKP